MNNNIWVHNLDPFVFKITESFGVRWYSLAYLSAFALGFLFVAWLIKKKRTPLNMEQLSDLTTYCILGVLLGGRLGYVLFYSPSMLSNFQSKFPFWEPLAVWEGGMASHGGFIGVTIAILLFARRYKIDPFHLGDLTVAGVCSGFFLGRIANFINGELMGKVAPADMSWAVKFPNDMHRWIGYEPEKLPQLKDTAALVGVSASDWSQWVTSHAQGQLYDTADRIINAIQGGNEAVRQSLGLVLEPRHPSQLYAMLGEGLIPAIILGLIWMKPRKPGLISAGYLLLYSCFRAADEMWRLPDAHLADLSNMPLHLSRGQFLSLFMFLGGLLMIVICLKRKAPPMGGICFNKSTGA